MATVFVDMIGFLIVLPLLPFYAERLGASPTKVGALVSIFALAQLISAPVWGRLSDRYGRRPMILSGLLISALAFILFESASTVWLLFLSRFVQGMGAGTIGVVQAYLSDAVPREERAQAMGWLTAATSAGVMVGPAIGSLAAAWGKVGPGYLAAGLCGLNFLFAARWLPESSRRRGDQKMQTKPATPRGAMRRTFLEILIRPRGTVGSLVWSYALGMMAFMAMNGVLALFLERRFGINETTIGWLYVYVGGISLVMRGILLGPVVKRFGEARVVRLGALAMAIGLALTPFCRSLLQLGLAIPFIPIGTALLFPVTTSLLSSQAKDEQIGLLLGVQQSFGGISRMVGPLWAGLLFQHVSISFPFWAAAGIMVGVSLFANNIRGAEAEGTVLREAAVVPPTEPS